VLTYITVLYNTNVIKYLYVYDDDDNIHNRFWRYI